MNSVACYNMRNRKRNVFFFALGVVFATFFVHMLYVNGALTSGVWRSLDVPILRSKKAPVVSHEIILARRRELIKKTCDRPHTASTYKMELTGHKASNFSYCSVAKAGCTIWLRILKYLNGQKKDSNTPMAISKFEVHYNGMNFLERYKMDGDDWKFILNSFRAMTVRNPYTRLWSAYIDKLFLPDFWGTKGKQIIMLIRKNPEKKSAECGYDVSFPEFIDYVLLRGHSFQFWGQDKHWLPASDMCDPCLFDPHVVAKQETFMADVGHVLSHVGLHDMLEKLRLEDPVEYEIQDEVKYNFKIFPQHNSCTDMLELCKRMWSAFILNGYIPTWEAFPLDLTPDDLTPESFYAVIQDTRSRNNVTRADTKRLRAQALATAYRHISPENLQRLKYLYKTDFEIFGYESEPPSM